MNAHTSQAENRTQALSFPSFPNLTSNNLSSQDTFLSSQPNQLLLSPQDDYFEQFLRGLDLGLPELPYLSAGGLFSAAETFNASSSTTFITTLVGWSVSRHEAFKKSLWVWIPVREASFLDCQHLSVDERELLQDPEAQKTRQSPLKLPRITDSVPRDGVFSIALKFAGFQPSVELFPSLNSFNLLMQTFLVKEHSSVDTMIHLATFDPHQCRYDLLAALIVEGSAMYAVPSVREMGLSLQEIVRRAICAGAVEDNTISLHLQAIQTAYFWIKAGFWSGVKKKMEIAEGFAHSVPSFLRRAGAFRKGYYLPPVVPCDEDEGPELRQRWYRWVELESFKRLVLRAFVQEMRVSIAFDRAPTLSVSELAFPLPASRALWDAPTESEWKNRYLMSAAQPVEISLLDIMHDCSLLDANKDIIDVKFASHAVPYAHWGRARLFLEYRSLTLQPSPVIKTTSDLLMETQRHELYQDIKTTVLHLSVEATLSSDGHLFSELMMLHLHASLDDMGIFASRFKADEYDNALARLKQWLHSEDRCRATWHAGQILRTARSFPPAELRGFFAIAVYQACLTLWAFAVLSANNDKEHVWTFMPMVALDKEETVESRLYVRSGRGCPCIHIGEQMEPIGPRGIPAVMDEIFRGNFSLEGYPRPPLVDDLYSLICSLSREQ